MMKKLLATAGVVTLAFGGPAAAFTIDFTDAGLFGSIQDSVPPEGGPITVKFGAFDVFVESDPAGSLTFNPDKVDGNDNLGLCGSPLACGGDGLGVVNDEVTAPNGMAQMITVSFFKTGTKDAVSLPISGFTFLDAFAIEGAQETANIDFLGAGSVSFDATETDDTNAGWINETLASVVNATGFKLTVSGTDGRGNPGGDLALAAVSIIPLPMPVLLLGAALAGFGVAGWRRRQAA